MNSTYIAMYIIYIYTQPICTTEALSSASHTLLGGGKGLLAVSLICKASVVQDIISYGSANKSSMCMQVSNKLL